jgi:hypothetical protein
VPGVAHRSPFERIHVDVPVADDGGSGAAVAEERDRDRQDLRSEHMRGVVAGCGVAVLACSGAPGTRVPSRPA